MAVIRFVSILSILFGILIILMPAILAYLVAAFFIFFGIAGLTMAGSKKTITRFFRLP